jgi:hypothetical protein
MRVWGGQLAIHVLLQLGFPVECTPSVTDLSPPCHISNRPGVWFLLK